MPTPAPNTYPFDGSGTAATNLVSNENQSLTLTNYRDYNFVIPNFAPFFADNLKVKHKETVTSPLTTLTEGIDYYPALSFVGATRATAKPVYGAISFTNLKLTGFLEITYQTVGGEWTLSVQKITELAANVIYNPRTTTWETLVNVPAYFPPLDHAWKLDDLVGQKEVLAGLDSIEKAILNRDTDANLLAHATNYSNPHRTSKSQVGLAKVMNYAPATLAESVEARRNDLYATPAGVKAFIDSLGLDKDLSFVSLEEVVTRKSVPKILTFDLFLEYMKLYGGSANTAPIDTGNLDRPIVIYPQELDNFLKGQPFKCTTYVDVIPGTITRIMDLTGTGTHTIPRGTNTLSITGRGGIGTEYVANFVVKTKTVSGMGSGSFIVPAGGNVLSLRGRGAPGFISNDIGVYKPTNNGSLVNLPTPVVNPGDPTWTYELVSKFSSSYVINSIMNSIVLTIDLKKNYSNNLSVVSNNIPCTLLLTNKSTDGILLTYKGNFTTAFSDTTLLSADFELKFERLPGTNISSGNEVTVTINTATIKFPGSTDLLSPNARIDDITLNPNVNAVVNYSSPAGTELDIIYQDFTNTGEWKITKYYSSKITNSSTGSSTLVEDTIGNVVVLPLAVTGEYMVDKNSITLDASPVLSTPQTLTLVPSESSSNKRVFENVYTIANTIVSVKVISEYVLNTGLQSKGPDALVTVFNTVHKFDGSPDNDTLPITRTDDIILDINSATTLTYNCPAGASVVLEYKEPNSAQPIAHSDTEWEVSKSDSFISANILDSTVLGKGTGFSLTTWKPTHADTFINNSDYYVRCRWVKSDATKSDWSDTRKFIFSVGAVNQPKDKELSRWCIGLDQWGTYADGNGGSYDRIISNNSVACGYVTPAPTGAQANTITVQLLSDLNVAYSGHNVIFTAVIGNTKAGSIYECELQQKYITESDYNYSKVNVSTITSSFTGDANTTTLKFSLAYSAIGAGNRVFKYRVTQSGFPVNTAVSTPININFTTPVTDNPLPTGPTPSTTNVLDDNNLKLTLTSSRTDIRIGDNEVLTVMLTGGIPGNEYQLLMITKNSTRLNDNGTTSLIRITANNSGTGTFTKDGGNDGSIPLGLYFTTVETLGRPIKVTSGTISRNFLGAYTNPRIVCSIIGSTDIDIGETRMARVDISGFEPSKTYTLRWYRTVPNTANRSVWNLNGTQITNNVVTSASGTGSIEIPVSNDGTLDSGAWRFDVDAYDSITNALVPTPGGNVEGVYNILVNTSISIVSNISYPSPIYTNTVERITYTISRAAPNRTINFVSRSTFVSGNTALLGGGTLDTNTPVDTLITVTTGSTGSATVVKEFRNVDNRIPGGSVWQRQALLTGTSTVSNILQSKYANSAISFKIESLRINSGNSAINKNDPDTITYGLSGLQSDIRYTVKWLYKVNTGPWIPAANIADTGFNSTSDRYSSSISPLIVSPNTTDQTHTLYLKAIVYDNNNNPTESNDLQWNYNNPSLQAFSPSLTSVKNGTAINKGAVDSITLNITNVKQSRYTLTWYTILDSNKSVIFNNALPSEITPTATTFNGSYTVPIDVGSVVQPRTLKYGVDIVEVVTNTTRSPTELSYTYSDQNNAFTIGISCGKPSQTVTRNSTDVINIVAQNLTPNANYQLHWYYQLGTGARIPLNDPALPTTINVNSTSTTINRQISVGYGVVCNTITNLNYYVDIIDSNNVTVSSGTPSGVSWVFDPAITAILMNSKPSITSINNKDTLSLTLNNLELNSTYQLTWYYRLDANTNERHILPNPNTVGLPGTISTGNKNSIGAQYTGVIIGKDIPLTDANNLIFYSVGINKQGDLTELVESTKCPWIWSTGNTAIVLPDAKISLGSNGVITLPINNSNNVVLLDGTITQIVLNKAYRSEWYVTLPGQAAEMLINNSVDSFTQSSSTSRNLTRVTYTIPNSIDSGQLIFRLFVYQQDDKNVVNDSDTLNITVNPAAAVIVPKPLINLTPVSTDPNPLTGVGGTVYLRAYVDSLIATETYDLTWEILKPNTISAITLSGLPTTVSGRTSDTINTSLNTGVMNIPGTTAGKLNIKLTITQRSNNTNNSSSNIDVNVDPAPTVTPLSITDISSSVNTISIDNQAVGTRLSLTVNGIVTNRSYVAVWRYKLPLSNTEYPLGRSNIQVAGGGNGDAADTFNITNLGSNTGALTIKADIYESISGVLQNTPLASRNIDITLTLPTPTIALSVASINPATGISTSSTNASVTVSADLAKLVATKSYELSWQVMYPATGTILPLPSSNNITISGSTSRTISKTFQITDVSVKGDVFFYGKITQVGDNTITATERTSINIGDPNIARPSITGVTVSRQDPTETSFFVGETNVGINLNASVSNLTDNEDYRYVWEYSIDNTNFTAIVPEDVIQGTGITNSIQLPVSGSINTGNNKATLTVRLTVTSVTLSSKTGKGSTTKSIIVRVPNTPDVNTVTSSISTFTQSTSVSNLTVSANVTNLSANDKYYLKFYYRLPGDTSPRYIGSEKLLTGSNPANIIPESSIPVNFTIGAITGVVTVGAEVYNSVTNAIKDIAETTYAITEIGSPVVTVPTSSKTTFTTNESASMTLGSSVSGLTSTETYNVTWEYILNGTTYSVPGGSSSITGQNGQSLSVNLNNINTGNTVNGTIVFKVTVAHSTNTNKKASNQVSYTIAKAAAVGINSMTVGTNTFVKGTTPLQVSLGANLTNLTPGKFYTVKWYYQFSTQSATQWIDLTADNTNIQSTTSQPVTKIVQFTPNIPTAPGSVVFKAVVTQSDDSSNTAEIPSTVIPITATSGGTGNTLATPNIGSVTSSNTDLKLNQAFNATITAPVSGLTPGVTYTCDWYYKIDNGADVKIETNNATSSTINAVCSVYALTVPNRSQTDTSARNIYFKVVISATGVNTTPPSVTSSSTSIGYNVINVSGGATPTLSFSNTTPSVSGTTNSSYTGTLTLNASNIPIGTVISLTNATYNGSSSITHSGASSYSVTYAGTYPSTAGNTSMQIAASCSVASTASATLSIVTTSSGTSGGTVSISSLTATNENTFKQSTTQGFSPKLTLTVSGLTPNTTYNLNWFMTYDGDTQPTPVITLKDDTAPNDVMAGLVINTSSTSVTKNVTFDPIMTSKAGVKFKVTITAASGGSSVSKETNSYPITPSGTGSNPTGLDVKLTLKNSITSINVTNNEQLTGSIALTNAVNGTDYTYFIEYFENNAWTTQTAGNIASSPLVAQNNNFLLINHSAITGTSSTVNLTCFAKNTVTSAVVKKVRVLASWPGGTKTSNELTLNIGAGTPVATHPTINLGFNTVDINDAQVYWEDSLPVTINVTGARPTADYEWTVAIAEAGTPATIAAVQQGLWSFGIDIWGSNRTPDPLLATTSHLKFGTGETTFSVPKVILNNEWGLLNPVKYANGAEVPFGQFREIQVCIVAYDGDPDLNFNIEKITLSDTLKIKFWQKNNQPVITMASTGPFQLFWDDSFTIGGNGSNINNLKVGATYKYTYAITDIATTNDLQSVKDGKWFFGTNPFIGGNPTDPTNPNVTKNTLPATTTFMMIPEVAVHSPWSNSVRVADVPLNGYKDVKGLIVAHIDTLPLDIDKVVLSPLLTFRIWNRPRSGDVPPPSASLTFSINGTEVTSSGWLAPTDVLWYNTSVTGSTPNSQIFGVFRYNIQGSSEYFYYDLVTKTKYTNIADVSNRILIGTSNGNGDVGPVNTYSVVNPFGVTSQTVVEVAIVTFDSNGLNQTPTQLITLTLPIV